VQWRIYGFIRADLSVVRCRQSPYETEESLTKYLPKRYQDAIQYVQVNGRTKIAIRGHISDYIPNPTFEVVARPGWMEEYFKKRQPQRQEPPGDLRRADALDSGFP